MYFPLTYNVFAVACFAAGAYIAFARSTVSGMWITLSLGVLFLVSSFLMRNRKHFRAILLPLCLIAGYIYTVTYYYDVFAHPLAAIEGEVTGVAGVVRRYEGCVKNKERYDFHVKRVHVDDAWVPAYGRIRLYNRADTSFEEGAFLIVDARVKPYDTLFDEEEDEDVLDALSRTMRYGVVTVYRRNQVFVDGETVTRKGAVGRIIAGVRRGVRALFASHLKGETYTLAKALLLGERSYGGMYETYRKAGIAHILAVSGLHFALVAGALFLVLSLTPLSFYTRLALAVLLTAFFFPPLTLFRASLLRASVMATILAGTVLLDKTRNVVNALFMTLFFLLLLNPNAIRDASVLLSFAATLGIALVVPALDTLVRELNAPFLRLLVPRYIVNAVFVSASALIFTLPFTLSFFGESTALSLVTNLYAVPLAFPLVLLLLLILAFSWVPPLASYFAESFTFLSRALTFSCEKVVAFLDVSVSGVDMPLTSAYVIFVALVAGGITFSVWVTRRYGMRKR